MARSASQLERVEAELKQEPTPHPSGSSHPKGSKPSITAATVTSRPYEPQVNKNPFSINLVRLSQKDIGRYMGKCKADGKNAQTTANEGLVH